MACGALWLADDSELTECLVFDLQGVPFLCGGRRRIAEGHCEQSDHWEVAHQGGRVVRSQQDYEQSSDS